MALSIFGCNASATVGGNARAAAALMLGALSPAALKKSDDVDLVVFGITVLLNRSPAAFDAGGVNERGAIGVSEVWVGRKRPVHFLKMSRNGIVMLG
jgi:hypothetical protein